MTKVVRRGLHTYGYLLIIATIITVFAALTTIGVSAEVTFDKSYYKYNGEEGVKIIGFNGLNDGETVTIPAELDGKPVLALGLEGALECIPGAEKIHELDLTQAANLKVIEKNAFSMCSNIKGTIESETVETVGEGAFAFCGQITSVNFPSCMTVEAGAFCITGLKPKQVTLAEGCSIGKGAFEFTQINDLINDINYGPYFDTKPYEYDVNHDGNISEDEKGVTITEFKPKAIDANGKVTIPAQIVGKPVLALGIYGSLECILGAQNIVSLDLIQATNLKVIERAAFRYCTGLTSFSAPNLTSVERYAFDCCTGLTSVNLPALETVETYAFRYCTGLTSFSAPKLITVEDWVFEGCTGLTSFSAPNLTSVGAYEFYGCTGLTSFSAPNLTSVGAYEFYGCTKLTSITLKEGCSIGQCAFNTVPDNCEITYVNNGNVVKTVKLSEL